MIAHAFLTYIIIWLKFIEFLVSLVAALKGAKEPFVLQNNS